MSRINYNGKEYWDLPVSVMLADGVPLALIGETLKATATAKLSQCMNGYRDQVASACAGKLMEYQFKANIAANRDTADTEHMALITREATARGMTTEALLDLIAQKHAAYVRIAFQIAAMEAEGKAAINAVPDDVADIETAVNTALSTFLTTAKVEFDQAFAEINGG